MDEIKKRAAERAAKMGLPYAGALLPAEAHALMQAGAKLVDVRTKPEVLYVGRVRGGANGKWRTSPASRATPRFARELAAVERKKEPVMFLCPSGARSHSAAEA